MELSSSCCEKLVFLCTWHGYLRESLELPKGSQVSCHMWCATRDGSGAKALQLGFILSWFGEHWSITGSCSDISVLLEFLQCSWGLFGVPTCTSMLLMYLMGNVELLCTQCREIGPYLVVRGDSHCCSWVLAGTWGILWNYGWDDPSKVVFV